MPGGPETGESGLYNEQGQVNDPEIAHEMAKADRGGLNEAGAERLGKDRQAEKEREAAVPTKDPYLEARPAFARSVERMAEKRRPRNEQLETAAMEFSERILDYIESFKADGSERRFEFVSFNKLELNDNEKGWLIWKAFESIGVRLDSVPGRKIYSMKARIGDYNLHITSETTKSAGIMITKSEEG